MKVVSMSGSRRENVGKKDAKALRRQGLVPCVMYGGKEQIHFTLTELQFRDVVFTPEASLVKLKVDNKEFEAILQDIQYHPVTDKVIHADFLEVIKDKPIKTDVHVTYVGDAPGIIKGGKLFTKLRKLRVKGMVDAIPASLEIDISGLEIGDSVKVEDVKYKDLEFLDYPRSVIVMVKTTRIAASDLEEGEEGEGEEGAEGAEGAKPEEGAQPKDEASKGE
ncbi:MAG: 50S ribosomal protein L25/general stress protein Ctc [Bacteroidales bacterium]